MDHNDGGSPPERDGADPDFDHLVDGPTPEQGGSDPCSAESKEEHAGTEAMGGANGDSDVGGTSLGPVSVSTGDESFDSSSSSPHAEEAGGRSEQNNRDSTRLPPHLDGSRWATKPVSYVYVPAGDRGKFPSFMRTVFFCDKCKRQASCGVCSSESGD